MNSNEISFQVYTARNFKPYQKIFEFISHSGISNIELFEVEAFDETKELLQQYNLTSLSSHIGFVENRAVFFNGSKIWHSDLQSFGDSSNRYTLNIFYKDEN